MYLMKLFVFTRSLKKRVRSCIAGILPYIALQLFLMMFAWPILLMWGLPISAASIIGYALFAPLLTLFLMLSSFIFFFELVSMPNKPFIWLLELLTQIWHTLLSISDRSWLWYFPKPPLLIALLIPLLACLIIQHRWAYSPIKIAACLCIFFFSTAALLTTRARNEPIRHIPCFEGELTVLTCHGNAALIDNTGCLGRRVSATNYVSYTLVPTLVQQGIQKLEVLFYTLSRRLPFSACLQGSSICFPSKTYICPPETTGRQKKHALGSVGGPLESSTPELHDRSFSRY